MDVDTFKLRLAGLPFLSKSEVESYQQRVTQGRMTPEAMYREALLVHRGRRSAEIGKKKREFIRRIANLPLNSNDTQSLVVSINENTNLLDLEERAKKTVEFRKGENLGKRRAKLSKTLTRIKINRSNKDEFLKRFDEGKDTVRALIENAKALEKKKASEGVAKERQFLKNAVTRIGISQAQQSQIMSKFKPGGVKALIEQARKIKQKQGSQNIQLKKIELKKLANSLGVGPNFLVLITSANTSNKVDALKETIEKAGETKRLADISNEKAVLTKIVKEIGIYDSFAGAITASKTMQDIDAIKLDIVEAGKVALSKLSNEKQVSENFSRAISNLKFTNRLTPLKEKIEVAGSAKNENKKKKNAEILAKNKGDFIEFVQKSNLPPNRKQNFINRMKLEQVNIPKLREAIATATKNLKNTQRAKDINELGAYVKNLNVNNTDLINRFKTTNISLENMKKEVNDIVKKKNTIKIEKNNLLERAKKISLNLNVTNVNSLNNVKILNEKIKNAYKKKLQENKKQLSNFALEASMNVLNDLSSINNINKIKNADGTIKQKTKNKLYNIVTAAKLDPRFIMRINSIKTSNDVKNIVMEIKNIRHETRKNTKTTLKNEERKLKAQERKVLKLTEYLTEIGLEPNEHVYFIEKMIMHNEPLNSMKRKANEYYVSLFKESRERGQQKLLENLSKLELNASNIEFIMNKYIKTYINPNTLMKEAMIIKEMREQERSIEMEEELIDYLDKLPLKPENRRKITMALNSYFVNFTPLKKSATNMAIKTLNEPRATQRKELENQINKMGLSKYERMQFLKMYNEGTKQSVQNYKNQKNLNNQTKKNKKFYLTSYIKNNLGLNESNERIKRIINNYNKYPENIDNLILRANTIKALADEKKRLTNRAKGLPSNERRDQKIKNAKNVNDIKKMNKEITHEYVRIIRKEISNMSLNSGLKFKLNLGEINTINEAEMVRAKLLESINRKYTLDLAKVQNAVKNMTPENQSVVLQKFSTRNVPINKILNQVTELKQYRADEKYKAERSKLYNYLNTNLNMNVEDRKTILTNFNTSRNLAIMMNKAKKLKNIRIAEKIAERRTKVENIIESMNLSDENKKSILKNFNSTPGTVLAFETKSKNLKAKRNREKRQNERLQLTEHLKSLKLSETNMTKILNVFDKTPEKTLTTSKLNATNLRKQRNRESLVEIMKGLMLSNAVRTNLLKGFRDNPDNLNKLISKAKDIDKKSRDQLELQKQTRNYVVSLQLGNMDVPILKKINETLTPKSARVVRAEAKRAKTEMNAATVEKKKSEIRIFVNKTEITADMKRSFLDSIKLNTNIDALKRRIQNVEQNLKNEKSKRGRLKAEFRVFLNTLSLSKEEKNRLEGNISNNTKNLSALKRKAKGISNTKRTMVIETEMREAQYKKQNKINNAKARELNIRTTKNAKAFKKNKNRKDRELLKSRLEKYLYSLPNIPQKRIDEYLTSYMNGKKTIEELTTISSAKNKQFAKTKKRLAILVPKLPFKSDMKKKLSDRLKTSRVNIDAFKTNIKNSIVKQFIPTKEKKKFINQLLKLD
jgi:hypothetical protein